MRPPRSISLTVAIGAAAAAARASCVESLLPIHASATNFDLSGLDPTLRNVPVSGTFTMELRLCGPTVINASHADTILVLSPGATYNTLYWDLPFQPETYSFVHFAAARGYTTLNVARLSDGRGECLNPDILQVPLQAALLVEIIRLARAGAVPGALGQQFRTVVGIGHSLSSGILNDAIVTSPHIMTAVVLSGYGHVDSGPPEAVPGAVPARAAVPARFGDLPDVYLTTDNIATRAAIMYGPPGTFDPAVLQFDEAHKDTCTVAEFVSFGLTQTAAPQFSGDVLAVVGAFDRKYCLVPGCTNVAGEAQYYPKARSFETAVIETSGHDLNLHFSAPEFFHALASWMDRHEL